MDAYVSHGLQRFEINNYYVYILLVFSRPSVQFLLKQRR